MEAKLVEDELSQEVSSFCEKYRLTGFLKSAVDIINKSFLSIKEMEFIIEQDPEIEEEWLLIDIAVDGTSEELLDAYDKYIEQWISIAPEPVREHIKLSFRMS